MGKVDLRTFVFIDSLQPQLTSYIATIARGYLPVTRDASMIIEVAPGIAINRITDVALKSTSVKPAVQVVERAFGLLEVHEFDQGAVRSAGEHILASLGLKVQDRLKPRIMTTQIITNVDDYQAMLINRGSRSGNMLLGGQTMYILEVLPAGYATVAANEAEKAAPISLIHLQPFGAYGRLWLGGTEADIAEAARAVEASLAAIDGREGAQTQ